MKLHIALLTLAFAAATGAQAEEKKAPTPQQEKMKACNADAKGKTGDERKAFMKECL
ncbi:MAG: PsiF family protein, partial [Roseateles sp.]